MYRAYYPAENPADYWKISICLVFLGHLVEGMDIKANSKQRGAFGEGILQQPCKSCQPYTWNSW